MMAGHYIYIHTQEERILTHIVTVEKSVLNTRIRWSIISEHNQRLERLVYLFTESERSAKLDFLQ